MGIARKIKTFAARRKLRFEKEATRERRGSNYNSASRIGFVYLDSDEDFFKKMKSYARYLKETFGVKTVRALGFVNEFEKKLPPWQSQKLEFEYITRDDLNWYLKPINRISTFTNDDLDILIDFSGGNNVVMNYIVKASRAKMKVGIRGTRAERWCDLVLNTPPNTTSEKFIEYLNTYLSNPKIK